MIHQKYKYDLRDKVIHYNLVTGVTHLAIIKMLPTSAASADPMYYISYEPQKCGGGTSTGSWACQSRLSLPREDKLSLI